MHINREIRFVFLLILHFTQGQPPEQLPKQCDQNPLDEKTEQQNRSEKENFCRIAFYFVILTCDALAGGPETMEISRLSGWLFW